jgi:glutamate-1-semialdehyde 2,1-aminomutase
MRELISQHEAQEIMNKRNKSRDAMARARAVIPGGVNSPVRAFGSVGGDPVFFERGEGAYLYDIDGLRYIDYIGSWGPAIAGHAHPEVLEAISKTAAKGLSFGAPTEAETVLAEMVRRAFPSMEKVRFVSSGTEACMSVLRVARAYTKRDKILKFTGCYHGHADMLLVKAGSGALTLGLPDSPGVPQGATSHTLLATYNDLDAVRSVFAQNPGEIAAVIVEPIVGNAGFIRPVEGFLEGLRQITREDGALLIFDEVMTGFRVAYGGVQELKGIKADLTTLGKVIGGGLPIGAYGGRKDIMAMVAPEGPVYQAGTLSGNPVAVASGLKTLEIISRPGAFARLAEVTRQLASGLKKVADKHGVPFYSDCEGGMFGFFFHKGPVRSLEEAKLGDAGKFKAFFWGMLDEGIYLAPSAYEAGFVSMAHSPQDIDATIAAADRVLAAV